MIKRLLNFIRYIWANSSNQRKVKYLRSMGCKIGDNNIILSSTSFCGSEPYLIEIGNDCLFSTDIKMTTHDGGAHVVDNFYKPNPLVDKVGRIKIGNNVFIGCNVLVMPNVTIGDNVIIGAGSVVTKNIPSNICAAGIPCRSICSLEEYYNKNLERKMFYPTSRMPKDKKKKILERTVPKL